MGLDLWGGGEWVFAEGNGRERKEVVRNDDDDSRQKTEAKREASSSGFRVICFRLALFDYSHVNPINYIRFATLASGWLHH